MHTYENADTYTVELTVTDNNGATAVCTMEITVSSNTPPVARFSYSPKYLSEGEYTSKTDEWITFDASASFDPDGEVTNYAWDFGDGTTNNGKDVPHLYSSPGTYNVVLTVTDNSGESTGSAKQISIITGVEQSPINTPPIVSFTTKSSSSPTGLSIHPTAKLVSPSVIFDASASYDPDGYITFYAWDFGDGANESGVKVSHTYQDAGFYTVELAVTDDDGATTAAGQTIQVSAPNNAPPPDSDNVIPTASFTAAPTSGTAPLTVSFDGSGSSDSDGSIASYSWDFGDGETSTGVTVSHTYSVAGTYTAQLTVADDDGATDSATRTIQVSAAPVANTPPTASFTATPSSGEVPLVVNFNASGSFDPDGSITSYAWTFGDGGAASGVTAAHTYNSAGTYTAQLTVTDDDGATDTTTTQIEVSASSVPEDLYVDANSGSDAAGDGTQANPYKTITKAVDIADTGSAAAYTIHVAAGIYNAALGEIFPLNLTDVTLVGQGAATDDVKIVGQITASSATVSNILSYGRITLGTSCALIDCILDNQEVGSPLTIWSGENSEVRGCLIQGGEVMVYAECLIVGNDLYSHLTVWGGQGVHVEGNTFHSVGTTAWGNATVTVRANTFLEGHVGARGQAHVIIEGNHIENSGTTGLSIMDSAIADLGGGPLGSTGGNVVIGSALWNMEDCRIACSGSLYAKNNTWDDPQPSGTVEGPIDSSPNYHISNKGNSIVFSDPGVTPTNIPPTASFTATPTSGTAPLTVTFDASSSSDPDGSITSYAWSFGDGGNASGTTATHTYTSAGTYTAQLTVTDDDGSTDSATRTIQVSAPSVPEDLYVDANSGSDTVGDGTSGNPFKRITKAIQVADSTGGSNTIHAAAGVYNTALGEIFPLALVNTELQGEGITADDVKVVGSIECGDNSGVKRLTTYDTIVVSFANTVTLRNLAITTSSSGYGIDVTSSHNVEIDGCSFEDFYPAAIRVSGGTGLARINDCDVSIVPGDSSTTAIEATGVPNLQIANLTSVGGKVRLLGSTIAVITGSTISKGDVNNYSPVWVDDGSSATLEDNELYAIQATGDASVVARRNNVATLVRVMDQAKVLLEHNDLVGPNPDAAVSKGVRLEQAGVIDLGGGPLGSRGGNTITGKDYNIYDERSAFSGVIYARGNTWDDPQPTGVISGPADTPPNYFIEREGNIIIFSD